MTTPSCAFEVPAHVRAHARTRAHTHTHAFPPSIGVLASSYIHFVPAAISFLNPLLPARANTRTYTYAKTATSRASVSEAAVSCSSSPDPASSHRAPSRCHVSLSVLCDIRAASNHDLHLCLCLCLCLWRSRGHISGLLQQEARARARPGRADRRNFLPRRSLTRDKACHSLWTLRRVLCTRLK